jgi:hypothetical protein
MRQEQEEIEANFHKSMNEIKIEFARELTFSAETMGKKHKKELGKTWEHALVLIFSAILENSTILEDQEIWNFKKNLLEEQWKQLVSDKEEALQSMESRHRIRMDEAEHKMRWVFFGFFGLDLTTVRLLVTLCYAMLSLNHWGVTVVLFTVPYVLHLLFRASDPEANFSTLKLWQFWKGKFWQFEKDHCWQDHCVLSSDTWRSCPKKAVEKMEQFCTFPYINESFCNTSVMLTKNSLFNVNCKSLMIQTTIPTNLKISLFSFTFQILSVDDNEQTSLKITNYMERACPLIPALLTYYLTHSCSSAMFCLLLTLAYLFYQKLKWKDFDRLPFFTAFYTFILFIQ